jgi:translation initiation factor 2 subunit 1
MEEACKAIDAKIKSSGGLFTIKMAPKVVTAMDDADLAKQLERAEMENAEASICF